MSTLFWVSFGALWVIVLFQGAILLEVVRRLADSPSPPAAEPISADPIPVGAVAPDFEARLLENGAALRSRALRGRRVLLAFTSAGCATCEATFGMTLAAARSLDAEPILVCSGARGDCRRFAHHHLPAGTALWDVDGAIAASFRVHSAPVSVALDEEWRVIKYGAPLLGGQPASLPLRISPAASEP
jgi:peroxiredoxin